MLLCSVGGMIALIAGLLQYLKTSRRRMLTACGFTEVLQPSPALLNRLESIYRYGPYQQFKLEALFEKRSSETSFYYFVLLETARRHAHYLGTRSIAVISPNLRLPRMIIAGRVVSARTEQIIGQAAQIMLRPRQPSDDLDDSTAGQAPWKNELVEIKLNEAPNLEPMIKVLADVRYGHAAESYLTRQRLESLRWLADKRSASKLECGRDCLIIERTIHNESAPGQDDILALLNDAQRALAALQ